MTTTRQLAREHDTLATKRPDLYRSAAIGARSVGSDKGTFIEDRGATVLRASVTRVAGTWRVALCGCATRSVDPAKSPACPRCAALFIGINQGITFPSKHTDTEWNDAHAELVKRAIPVDHTPENEPCRVCGIRGGDHTASCDYQPDRSRYYDDI